MELPIKGEQLKDNTVTIGHKIPLSKNGSNDISNKVLACYKCNTDKAHFTEEEYFAVLRIRNEYNDLKDKYQIIPNSEIVNECYNLPKGNKISPPLLEEILVVLNKAGFIVRRK